MTAAAERSVHSSPAAGPAARSVFLGGGRGRWTPGNYADVVAAVDEGLLVEDGYHLELKREIPTGAAANKELGRDLASFAPHGGLIIVGVSDLAGVGSEVVGVELTGLAERVDAVARSRVHPPLTVLCRSLPDPADPTRGVLLVEVPPSPDAPHMAEDRYWGRSATGKHPLADAEVRDLMTTRAREDAAELIGRLVSAESHRVKNNPLGSLFVHAVPRTPRADALDDLLYGAGADVRLIRLAGQVHRGYVQAGHPDFEPNLATYLTYEPRSNGVELRTISGAGDAPVWPDLLHVLLGTDGSVRVVCGRGTDEFGDGLVLIGGVVIGLVRTTLALAAHLAGEAGYIGSWDLGIALENISGAVDFDLKRRGGRSAREMTEEAYRRAVTASTPELADTPGTVTGRLTLPLLRALDAVPMHQRHLTDPPSRATP